MKSIKETTTIGLIEPDDVSRLSTTRSLMELNPKSNDFLHAQPRHSTVSAYMRKTNRRSEDIESTMFGTDLATVSEERTDFEQKKTLLNAIRGLKNEVKNFVTYYLTDFLFFSFDIVLVPKMEHKKTILIVLKRIV